MSRSASCEQQQWRNLCHPPCMPIEHYHFLAFPGWGSFLPSEEVCCFAAAPLECSISGGGQCLHLFCGLSSTLPTAASSWTCPSSICAAGCSISSSIAWLTEEVSPAILSEKYRRLRAHRFFLDEAGVAELLRTHVVHVGDGQAAERLADELDVVPLYVAHHQDLRLRLIRRHQQVSAFWCHQVTKHSHTDIRDLCLCLSRRHQPFSGLRHHQVT